MQALSKPLLRHTASRLSRRAFLGGVILASGCIACERLAQAQSMSTYGASGGCWLQPDEAAPLMEDTEIISYATGNEDILPKSGIAGFDRALARSLARLTNTFDVLPGFGYYTEQPGEDNAYATPAVRLDRADGTVLFGTRMLERLLHRPEAPDAAVLAVCAHEYGHIVQSKYDLRNRLLAGQATVRRLELNADYLAGYFAGRRKLENGNFPAAVFASTQHSFGDFNTSSKGHHGTPDERAGAVVAGFEAAHSKRLDFQQALEDGLAYVGA